MVTEDDVIEWFDELQDEYLEIEKVDSPMHARSDLAAFLLLSRIVGGTKPIISHADNGEIFFSVNVRDLVKAEVTREQVLTLIRLGVRCDDENLAMFT